MKITKFLFAALVPLLLAGVSACGTDDPAPEPPVTKNPTPDPGPGADPDTPDNPDDPIPGPDEPGVPPEPAVCNNIVVAHRGGAKELGETMPDNSIASLEYAQSLGCYASECDIYMTTDRHVIVAHVDGDGKVNGYYPFMATLEELRAAGTLSNGEQIPTLEEYLDHAMKPGSCTRLWLDIKNVTKPSTLTDYPVDACKIACEIIAAKKAEKWVEFICTGNETVMQHCAPVASKHGINIGWMANRDVTEYKARGYTWANMNVKNMTDATHSGPRSVDEFVNEGLDISVYNVDKPKNMRYYIERIDKMKAICTNYPALLLQEMGLRE